MKVLNLYAGVGGNRKLWDGCQVTAVESNPKIAAVYQRLNPADSVVVGDAHDYLLQHVLEYDFVWSSPPCQSHSRMMKGTRHKRHVYPDLALYQEILFLQHFAKCKWVVENVVPYYTPLVAPSSRIGRHLFWTNFYFLEPETEQLAGFIQNGSLKGKRALQDWLGIHYEETIYYGDNHDPAQVLRNCVHPHIGNIIYRQMLTTLK